MSKKTNYSYVGITFIILLFGIIFIPKIIDRVSQGDITRDESRSKGVSTYNNAEKDSKKDKSDFYTEYEIEVMDEIKNLYKLIKFKQ